MEKEIFASLLCFSAVHRLILEKRGGAYSEEGERGILVKQWMVAFAKRAHLE